MIQDQNKEMDYIPAPYDRYKKIYKKNVFCYVN